MRHSEPHRAFSRTLRLKYKRDLCSKNKIIKKKNNRERHVTANPSFSPCPSVHRNPEKPKKITRIPTRMKIAVRLFRRYGLFFLAAVYVHGQDRSYRGTEESYLIRIQILSMCHCSSYGRRKNGNLKRHY